jgi:tRNA (guanine-N7-)-methyltransferase
MTEAQRHAYAEMFGRVGLSLEDGKIDIEQVFQRKTPTILEIGFGSGQSLLAMAKMHPEINFIGIEMHLPGIAALLLGMQQQQIDNIRIYYADAVMVMAQCIPENSLDGVQIFFPDPWPKRKHHKRRLIQTPFVSELAKRLKLGGILHLATDWQDYAIHMMKTISRESLLTNLISDNQFATRSTHRPLITKFEQRGLQQGREIYELQFIRPVISDCSVPVIPACVASVIPACF